MKRRVRMIVLLGLLTLGGVGGGCSIPPEPMAQIAGEPVRFTGADTEAIRDFYGKFEFPPALRDPSVIAAPLAERLEISAKVPPGLAATPLPQALQERLSPLPPGYERFRAGEDVILMDSRTREVTDIVPNVFETPPGD